MEISLHYASDGHWRVKTNLDGDEDEGFAQTEKRNINIHLCKSSVVNCAWKVKVNLLEDTGMEPAPELQVFALDQSETILRQASTQCFRKCTRIHTCMHTHVRTSKHAYDT